MSDDEAFIRAIMDSPGDETPRMVYADWLEERGDPRGAYLRAEQEAVRTGDTSKMEELAAGLDPVWVARVTRPPLGVCCEQVDVRGRGFAVDAQDIEQFEQRFGITLPYEYRAFMLNYNGCVIDYSGGLNDYNFRTPDGELISLSRSKHMFFSLERPAQHGGERDLESLASYLNQRIPERSYPDRTEPPPHGGCFRFITVGLHCFGQLGLGLGGAVGNPTVIPVGPFHQLGLLRAVAGEVLRQHVIRKAEDFNGYVILLLPGTLTARVLAPSFAEFLSILRNPDYH